MSFAQNITEWVCRKMETSQSDLEEKTVEAFQIVSILCDIPIEQLFRRAANHAEKIRSNLPSVTCVDEVEIDAKL